MNGCDCIFREGVNDGVWSCPVRKQKQIWLWETARIHMMGKGRRERKFSLRRATPQDCPPRGALPWGELLSEDGFLWARPLWPLPYRFSPGLWVEETLCLLERGTFLLRRGQISLSLSRQLLEATRGGRVAGGSGLHGPDSCSGEPRPAALPAQLRSSALGLRGPVCSEQGWPQAEFWGDRSCPNPLPTLLSYP